MYLSRRDGYANDGPNTPAFSQDIYVDSYQSFGHEYNYELGVFRLSIHVLVEPFRVWSREVDLY